MCAWHTLAFSRARQHPCAFLHKNGTCTQLWVCKDVKCKHLLQVVLGGWQELRLSAGGHWMTGWHCLHRQNACQPLVLALPFLPNAASWSGVGLHCGGNSQKCHNSSRPNAGFVVGAAPPCFVLCWHFQHYCLGFLLCACLQHAVHGCASTRELAAAPAQPWQG